MDIIKTLKEWQVKKRYKVLVVVVWTLGLIIISSISSYLLYLMRGG